MSRCCSFSLLALSLAIACSAWSCRSAPRPQRLPADPQVATLPAPPPARKQSRRTGPRRAIVATPIDNPAPFAGWHMLDWDASYSQVVATVKQADLLVKERVGGKGTMIPYVDVIDENGWKGLIRFDWKRKFRSVYIQSVSFSSPDVPTRDDTEPFVAAALERYGPRALLSATDDSDASSYVWNRGLTVVTMTVHRTSGAAYRMTLEFAPGRSHLRARAQKAWAELDRLDLLWARCRHKPWTCPDRDPDAKR